MTLGATGCILLAIVFEERDLCSAASSDYLVHSTAALNVGSDSMSWREQYAAVRVAPEKPAPPSCADGCIGTVNH
jgi:hypothetical protein